MPPPREAPAEANSLFSTPLPAAGWLIVTHLTNPFLMTSENRFSRMLFNNSWRLFTMKVQYPLIFITLVTSCTFGIGPGCMGSDEPIMTGTAGSTQGLQVVNTDVGSFILNNNPVCPESDRKPKGNHKLLSSNPDCGKQVKLQTWTCTTTGEEGWTQEIFELEPCK
jgi:hypothetical protein